MSPSWGQLIIGGWCIRRAAFYYLLWTDQDGAGGRRGEKGGDHFVSKKLLIKVLLKLPKDLVNQSLMPMFLKERLFDV